MSCNHCTTKFNFFHKEMGCSNCGLSFCNKCLKQKCRIPSKGPGEYTVCRTCHLKLTAGSSSSQEVIIQPPDAYLNSPTQTPNLDLTVQPKYLDYHVRFLLRRLELLENPMHPPITMYKHNSKLQSLRTGLSPVDQQLLDRLEKLKEDKSAPPSEGELRVRLANLKGVNNYVEGPSKNIFAVDSRTDQQKMDALLEQFMREKEIELAHNPQEEIEARLATLRERGVRPNEGPYISNLHDSSSGSEEEMDKITKKIMDEVALEKRCPVTPMEEDNENKPDDRASPELPWCVLCNKDARFRCLDCGGDLYCSECNTEVHKNWGDTDHRVVGFQRKQ